MTNQNLDFGIYLVEPVGNITFNKGILFNAGFLESRKISYDKWDCFFFHGVDTIPEYTNLKYTCNKDYPVHFAVAVSKYGYK